MELQKCNVLGAEFDWFEKRIIKLYIGKIVTFKTLFVNKLLANLEVQVNPINLAIRVRETSVKRNRTHH